jgi:hypothetical protein
VIPLHFASYTDRNDSSNNKTERTEKNRKEQRFRHRKLATVATKEE